MIEEIKKTFKVGGKCRIRTNVEFNAPHLSPEEAEIKARELNPDLPVKLLNENGDIHILDVEKDAFYYDVHKDMPLERAAYLVSQTGTSVIDIDHINRRIITEGIINGL